MARTEGRHRRRSASHPRDTAAEHEGASREGPRAKSRAAKSASSSRGKRARSKKASSSDGAPVSTGSALEAALRTWRSTEAKKRRVPAFRILTDRTLVGIAETRPTSEAQLLAVSGMGMALLAKYGAKLLAIVARA